MKFSLPWWVAAVSLAGGYASGRWWGPADFGAGWIAAGCVAAWGLAGIAWVAELAGRGRFPWRGVMLTGIALCGLVRGADAGSREPLAWVTASRGSVVGWQDFAVVAASTPGPFCTVEARWIGSAAAVTFHAPAGACPLAQGQRVRVRVPWSRSPPLPGEAPRSVAGPFRVDGLWPLDRAADPYWSWVAGLRQR